MNNYYGLLISYNNNIIHEKYVNNNENTKFRIFSCSKPITGLAIVLLSQMKLLNLSDTIDVFNINIPYNNIITIYHLLQHTSGIYDFISNLYFHLKPIKLFNNIINNNKTNFIDFDTIINEINLNKPQTSPLQNIYKYNNTGYDLLGYIIYIVTGLYTNDFIKFYIFNKLNMTDSNFQYNNDIFESTPYDNFKKKGIKEQQNWFCGNAFIVCTLRDYNKFLYNYHILLDGFHLNFYENLYYFNSTNLKNKTIKYIHHEGGGDFDYLHSINYEKYNSLSKSFIIKLIDSNNNIITIILSENFRLKNGFFFNNKLIIKKIINHISYLYF